jgi:hypothetical protein
MGRQTLETDPIRLAVDENRNLIVPLRWAKGVEAVVQGIDARLRLIKGEVFWDLDAGVPWFENDTVDANEAIMGQPFDDSKIRAVLRKAILDTPNTNEADITLTLSFDGTTRTMTVDWEVGTLFGDTGEGGTATGTTTIEV